MLGLKEAKFEKKDNPPPREKVERKNEVPEKKEEGLELRRFEDKRSEKESRDELEEAHRKMAEAKREKEERKKSIFERIKEFVGLSGDKMIRFDDLILDDSEDAWRMREEKAKENKDIIATAAGIKSKRAEEFLKKAAGSQENWRVVSVALMYNDAAWADEIRERLGFGKEKSRPRAGRAEKAVRFLGWHKSERFFKRRQTIDQILNRGFYFPGDLLLSETGVPAANKTKQKLWQEFKDTCPVEAILCHLGDSSIEAQGMAEKVYRTDEERLKWAYERYEKSIGEGSEKN